MLLIDFCHLPSHQHQIISPETGHGLHRLGDEYRRVVGSYPSLFRAFHLRGKEACDAVKSVRDNIISVPQCCRVYVYDDVGARVTLVTSKHVFTAEGTMVV